MTQPTNSDTLEPADLLLIGLPFMNDAWAKYPNDREHMKQAFKASEGYKQALTALTEREDKLIREAKDEVLDELIEWYENPPVNEKPFNWYGAVKALKISKDFKKPFHILPTASSELTKESKDRA